MLPYLWYAVKAVQLTRLLLNFSPSIWAIVTLKLHCFLAKLLQHSFPLPCQTEHWSKHNHSVCYKIHLFPNSLPTSHQSSLLLCSSLTKRKKIILAVFLKAFHGFLLQPILSLCSKFWFSPPGNSKWQFLMYLSYLQTSIYQSICHNPTIWKQVKKPSNTDHFQK